MRSPLIESDAPKNDAPEKTTKVTTDDEYSQLQVALLVHPDTGAIIPHSGGLRKVRWSMSGRGKRSGVRVIYY